MRIGFLTSPFGREPLENAINFAGESGFDALEIASGAGGGHIDVTNFNSDRAKEIKTAIAKFPGLMISSLAMYINSTDVDNRTDIIANFKKAVDAAVMLDVDVLCLLAGMPVAGKDKFQTIREDCKEVFAPVLDYAAGKGVKIALENWFATNIQNLAHWRVMFEVLPHDNFGLNFDPSHLLWQGIDYIAAVEEFAPRIFHTHAKDTEIKEHVLRIVGNQSGGWWRYVIPGFGRVNWGEYLSVLRRTGYNGVLSIEHEDGAQGRQEGFIKGLNYLRLFA